MIDIVTKHNCVYQTAYHVIWCPKYRHDVLTERVAEETGAILEAICVEWGWPMISKEIQPDPIHLFVSIPPSIAVSNTEKVLKGVTARRLFQRFAALKKRLCGGHLWSPSYYVGTAGSVSAGSVRRYIERSELVTKRR